MYLAVGIALGMNHCQLVVRQGPTGCCGRGGPAEQGDRYRHPLRFHRLRADLHPGLS
jgi:hypothetical protein